MQRNNLWKALIILVILGLCALSMYPPQRKLKPGLDLAGGTTLVYEVQVPEGVDAKETIDRTISVLRERVDPAGVRNLIWRPQAGNRIEIQMALPGEQIGKMREAYIAAQKQVLAGNLSMQVVDTLLRAEPAQRETQLTKLTKGDGASAEIFKQLLAANDALTQARAPYEAIQQEQRDAQAAIDALPADASDAKKAELQKQVDELLANLTAKTRAFLDARKKFDAAQKAVLVTNVEPADLERLVALPDKLDSETIKDAQTAGEKAASPRQTLLDKLVLEHPARAEQIKKFIDAYRAYEAVKGPLDDPNDLIQLLRGSGVLEFRIAATASEVPDLQAYKEQLKDKGPRGGEDKPYRWFAIDKVTGFAERKADQEFLRAQPETYFANRGLVGQEYAGKYYILLGNSSKDSLTQAQQGWKLTQAFPSRDQSGFPAVAFELNNVGGQYMGNLTGSHIKKPMAILLDNKVMSAPTVNDRIAGNGIITGGRGGFGEKELDYLIRTLAAGSLQARVGENPISIQTTGPQFGQDNLTAGLKAVFWAILIVSLFMASYYFFFGLVADAAMLANLVLVLGVMSMLDATFTLPGIAGLVLTVGMAVDANVLVYERIREELERNVPISTAVRLGFQKAWATIIDAHVTALITCVVLGYTATADIKGFAVTLGIGLLANLFTGVFCTRVVIELFIDSVHPSTLKMLPMVSKTIHKFLSPHIDWIGKRFIFLGLSWVLALAGLISIYTRGPEFLDIEFRSGTQVGFELAKGKMLSLQEVRKRLTDEAKKPGLSALADASAVTVGDAVNGQYKAFTVSTILTDVNLVSTAVKEAFEDSLDVQRPISYENIEAKTVPTTLVFPVKSAKIGEDIGRPELTNDVSDYLGGVAIMLKSLSPAPTVDELTDRIQRMRLQPSYEGLGLRQFTVIGLDAASKETATTSGDGTHYRTALIISHDTHTNYAENPAGLAEPRGLASTEWELTRDALQRDTSLASVSKFDSQFSQTMKQQAIVATFASCLAILIYIWFRFGGLRYGVAAIVATMHDFVIALGMIGLSAYLYEIPVLREVLLLEPFRLNLAQVAALLTLIGYSLNDTVVVFDRIRENRGRLAVDTPGIINDSINQTISRTILTSVTTFIAVLVLYVVGGTGVRGFAYTMLIGVVVGTYSSIAIAAPLLLIGQKQETQKPTR